MPDNASPAQGSEPSSLKKLVQNIAALGKRAADELASFVGARTPNASRGSLTPGTGEGRHNEAEKQKVKLPPSAAAGSARDLETPTISLEDEMVKHIDFKEEGGTCDKKDSDGAIHIDSDNDDNGATDVSMEVVASPDKNNSPKSPGAGSPAVVSLDNSLGSSHVSASKKFLQQALLKSKGSQDSPICLDTPGAAIRTTTRDDSLDDTPLMSRTDSSSLSGSVPSDRKPLREISNNSSSQHSPVVESAGRTDLSDDEFGDPILGGLSTPISASKKNKRRSVCALATPRRTEDRPVSPSGYFSFSFPRFGFQPRG